MWTHHLELDVSRCRTFVNVQHSYDIRTTRVGQVKQVSQKNCFYITSTFF